MPLFIGRKIVTGPSEIKKGSMIKKEIIENFTIGQMWQLTVSDKKIMDEMEKIRNDYEKEVKRLQEQFEEKVEKIQDGDELLPGVLKMVKVFVAVKRKLQPGDKMAGRHGNKGVISRIARVEDMPYLEDGTPVDVVLNPLGVPSRMNVGQILETHLGWASAGLGKQIGDILKNYSKEITFQSKLKSKLSELYGKTNWKKAEEQLK